MLVMVAQAQRSAGDLYTAASNGDKAVFVQLSARGNKGNAYAQFNLGVLSAQVNGVSKDSTQAVSWCRRLSQPKAPARLEQRKKVLAQFVGIRVQMS